MIHTFLNLQNQVLHWLDEASSGATGTTRVNVRNALNAAQIRRLTMYPWPHMIWGRTETITTVSGTTDYMLHQEYMRPLYFRNQRTHELLVETPAKNIEPSRLDWNSDSDGNRFVIWGRSPVKAQPTSASVITIVSSSASDTGSANAVVIKGETSDGSVTAEMITPNGTSSVAGTTQFVKILAVTKASSWTGTLTVTSNSAAVTNLTLNSCEYGRQYPIFRLLSNITAGDVIEYQFYRQPMTLVNDFDIPEIPAPFSEILVWDALLDLLAYDSQLDGARMNQFSRNAQSLEDNMVAALWEGQSLGAEPRFIRERGTISVPFV
jgi:hypothetical protein